MRRAVTLLVLVSVQRVGWAVAGYALTIGGWPGATLAAGGVVVPIAADLGLRRLARPSN